MSILYAYDSLNRFGIFNCLLIKVNSNIFFLFVIITDLSKQGTDPNFSGMLTPLCFYFAPPENIRKPLAFQCFQEVQNGDIDHKCVKEVDRNNSNLPMIVNSIHVFKSLSLSLSLSLPPLILQQKQNLLQKSSVIDLEYHVILDTLGIVQFSIS